MTNSLVKMKPAIDLEVIALVSGWQMEDFTMTCMIVQIMGTILNRCVGFGDWKWGQQWEFISRSMKVYALSNLRATSAAVIVMLGIIIRDYFPDPDVLCKHLQLYQHDACHWFSELFLMSFRNKEINREAVRGATTREEFILSIRGRDLLGNLEDAPDNKINLWVNLLGSWPTITTGGPRYILHVRYHFLHQIDVINDQGVTWDVKSSIKVPNEDETTYILFGISKGRLTRANWNAPLISNHFGPVRLEAIQSKSLNFKPAATSHYRTIVDLCKTRQLSQRGAVLEWARGNPEQIQSSFYK